MRHNPFMDVDDLEREFEYGAISTEDLLERLRVHVSHRYDLQIAETEWRGMSIAQRAAWMYENVVHDPQGSLHSGEADWIQQRPTRPH